MKKFIIWVLCITLVCLGYQTSTAQNVKREGKTFTATSVTRQTSSSDIVTAYMWKDKDGNEYPIYLHKYTKGSKSGQWGAYVIKQSQKTGKEYKSYFRGNEEVAKEIINENPTIINK